MGKEGPSGSAVANFILMFILFFVIYLILWQAGQGRDISNLPIEDYTSPGTTPSQQNLLLSESPGRVYPYAQGLQVFPLASVQLFAEEKQEISTLANSISVSRSMFSDTTKELSFTASDSLKEASLLFLIGPGSGNLIIKLNGVEIFNKEPGADDLPLELPKNLIKQKNKLTFEAEKPSFLGSNSFELQDIKVIKKYAVSNMREARTFSLSRNELQNLDRISISYFINCIKINERGRLDVVLNGKIINSNLVVCDAGRVHLDLDRSELQEGRNVLEFRVDQGNYILEQLSLEKDLIKAQFPIYYFTLQRNDFADVYHGAGKVVVDFDFNDAVYRKAATVIVNGDRFYIDTLSNSFSFDISDFVVEGQNFIRVIPRAEFDIIEVRMSLL